MKYKWECVVQKIVSESIIRSSISLEDRKGDYDNFWSVDDNENEGESLSVLEDQSIQNVNIYALGKLIRPE